MWVITTRGFYSAVQHRKKPDHLLIRARNEEDIRNLKDFADEILKDSEPWSLVKSDYEWRLECTKDQWAAALEKLTQDIDYDNFKNAVKKRQGWDRSSIYMGVWSKLLQIERDSRSAEKWGGVHTGHGIVTGSGIPVDGGRLFELDTPPSSKAASIGGNKNSPSGPKPKMVNGRPEYAVTEQPEKDEINNIFGVDRLAECTCHAGDEEWDFANHELTCERGDELELIEGIRYDDWRHAVEQKAKQEAQAKPKAPAKKQSGNGRAKGKTQKQKMPTATGKKAR